MNVSRSPTNAEDYFYSSSDSSLINKLNNIKTHISESSSQRKLDHCLEEFMSNMANKNFNLATRQFLQIKKIVHDCNSELAATLNVTVVGKIERHGNELEVNMHSVSFSANGTEECLKCTTGFPQILDQNLRESVILNCSYNNINLASLRPELRLSFAYHLEKLISAIHLFNVTLIESELKELKKIPHPDFRVSTNNLNNYQQEVVISCGTWQKKFVQAISSRDGDHHVPVHRNTIPYSSVVPSAAPAAAPPTAPITNVLPHNVANVVTTSDSNTLRKLWESLKQPQSLIMNEILPQFVEIAIIVRRYNRLEFKIDYEGSNVFKTLTLKLTGFEQFSCTIMDRTDQISDLIAALSILALAKSSLDKLMSEFKAHNVLQLTQPDTHTDDNKEAVSFITPSDMLTYTRGVVLLDSDHRVEIVTFVEDKEDTSYQVTQLNNPDRPDSEPFTQIKATFVSGLEDLDSPVFLLNKQFTPEIAIAAYNRIRETFALIFSSACGQTVVPADISRLICYATIFQVQERITRPPAPPPQPLPKPSYIRGK